MDDLERELRVWLKAGMPDYPSLAAIVRVKFAEKDAELANRHAEVERLRGFVAELRRDSLHTDLVATLAEKNAELAHLTAEVEALRAEHEAVGDYLTRRGCLEVTSDQTMEQAISRQRNSRDAMEQAHAAVEARKEPT